jgi:hypothetical protein
LKDNMNKNVIWMIPLLAVSASVAVADINLNFINSNQARDQASDGDSITLDFIIDGSGDVTLDATAVGGSDVEYLAAIDSWDGNAGTVSSSALFGTSFQLTVFANSVDPGNSAVRDENLSLDGRYGSGLMAVGGQNSSRIDHNNAGGPQEFLHFQQTGGDAQLNLLSFDWHGASSVNNLWDTQVIAGTVDNTFLNLAGSSGNVDVSGFNYVIGSGANDLTFSMPINDASHGLGIAGLTFQAVEVSAVPEPATCGLLAAFGASMLLPRRRSRRS